jgi:hypothetical protein
VTVHRAILAAVFTFAVGAALADGLGPVQGRRIDLGAVSGVAYYTVERNGFRVVATLAQGEAGTPVRIEAVLAPGQKLVLSTPRGVGHPANAVEISRRGDRVLVQEAAGTH